MIKTQITVPDELYNKAKEIARTQEWSLAEVFRRGLEYMARTHPTSAQVEEWQFPDLPADRFADDLDQVDLREVLEQDETVLINC